MTALSIELSHNQTTFQPGETIRGNVQWDPSLNDEKGSLRLLWYTQGRGTEDIGIAETLALEGAQLSSHQSFTFTAPIGPYSFSGSLISLIWALELQLDKECCRQEIVISPTEKEILLQ